MWSFPESCFISVTLCNYLGGCVRKQCALVNGLNHNSSWHIPRSYKYFCYTLRTNILRELQWDLKPYFQISIHSYLQKQFWWEIQILRLPELILLYISLFISFFTKVPHQIEHLMLYLASWIDILEIPSNFQSLEFHCDDY